MPELLSELTLHIYLARVTPITTLRRVVRSNFVPAHYPATVARLYEWSPDEAIPELFTEPSIFRSIHEAHGLRDLAVPAWCRAAADAGGDGGGAGSGDDAAAAFVAYHRSLLESDAVSAGLPL